MSRRSNFLSLDEPPFTNDWFTPAYVDVFRDLPEGRRPRVVTEQKLASDGISPDTLKALYRRFYRLAHLEGESERIALLPNRELQGLARRNAYEMDLQNHLHGEAESHCADLVILCTGLREALTACLASLQDRLQRDSEGRLLLDGAFGAQWQGASGRRLYFLGAGRYSHGIAEPQLSLSAWRAAQVVNDLAGRTIYDTDQSGNFIQWITQSEPRVEVA